MRLFACGIRIRALTIKCRSDHKRGRSPYSRKEERNYVFVDDEGNPIPRLVILLSQGSDFTVETLIGQPISRTTEKGLHREQAAITLGKSQKGARRDPDCDCEVGPIFIITILLSRLRLLNLVTDAGRPLGSQVCRLVHIVGFTSREDEGSLF